jgi:parallel beta-helix repeat protein
VTLRRVRASFNAGPGLWFDVKNADITVEECTVIGNTGAGIFMEISQGPCLIRNNLAMNNPTGIVIAETDDCTVVNNTCVRNERGFAVRYSDRKGRGQERKANAGNTPPQRLPIDRQEAQGAYTLRNLVVRNNVLAFNNRTQLDAASFTADSWRDAHKNNYQSDHNLLWSGPGKASLISWQSGAVHDLAAWPEHKHWEQHSVVAAPTFLAESPYDFRLAPSSPAAQAGAKPAVPFPDRFGRQQLLPNAGAIQPVLHTPWASRTLKGKGETHRWPLPN